ncbi:MAG: transcription/translation regulatory transformer protein RfaH [Methylococcales bacterium]
MIEIIDKTTPNWYVIHTKPKEEQRALRNLEQQGYECYLPVLTVEKLRRGTIRVIEEPLFSRYLFIHLDSSESGKSWAPIRSTLGVSRLVVFGNEPAKVDEQLIENLRAKKESLCQQPQSLFTKDERLVITDGPFIGLEAIYQMHDGESRAMVLINLLNKPVQLKIAPDKLRKATG